MRRDNKVCAIVWTNERFTKISTTILFESALTGNNERIPEKFDSDK